MAGGNIQATKDGPYEVTGEFTVVDHNGNPYKQRRKVFLCRCGGSSNKPYCDGTHVSIRLQGRVGGYLAGS